MWLWPVDRRVNGYDPPQGEEAESIMEWDSVLWIAIVDLLWIGVGIFAIWFFRRGMKAPTEGEMEAAREQAHAERPTATAAH